MKRILLFLLAAAVVFALKTATPAEAKPKVVARTFTGSVLWVDPIQNTIVLKGGEEEARFQVRPYTKLKRRGKAAVLSKFLRDDKVTITYRVERKTKIATAIY